MSGQSFVTPHFAYSAAKMITQKIENSCIILSAQNMKEFQYDNYIINGQELSFRENAELTKYCSLLIGASSGISWICTSDWAKKLPMIQLINKRDSVYSSFIHDYEARGDSTGHIIEFTDCKPEKVFECTKIIFEDGFDVSRNRFNQKLKINFTAYSINIFRFLFIKGDFSGVKKSFSHVVDRYGHMPQFYISILLLPYNLLIHAFKFYKKSR
jgi:hypothetical protein